MATDPVIELHFECCLMPDFYLEPSIADCYHLTSKFAAPIAINVTIFAAISVSQQQYFTVIHHLG